ncbi:MAG TPA: hydantoinase/oxoprolinase family protein [Candidatus Binataceae bacterium]|nr:hydantoinase/oxoprolinase family protein [Candidatus Binataceae bacterium]
MQYVIGVDIGGTCTDCVVMDTEGRITVAKAFSTPADFSQGILNALEFAAQKLGLERAALLKQTKLFLHGTTMAENAIVDDKMVKAGVLVTRGFEDTLFLMRGGYAEWSGRTEDEMKDIVNVSRPPMLTPREMIVGIRERVDANGETLATPDPADVERAVQHLAARGAEAIGVSFLWSFVKPDNELEAQRVIRELYPELFCTVSSEIAPIMGEFERTQTVVLNARLGPAISNYLNRLEQKLNDQSFDGALLIMQAYGGLLGAREAASRPVGLIESGPVSGLVGSKALGEIIGFRNIIGADMGGTTFKAGVVSDGMIDYEREPMILRYHYALPKMNVASIGVAGGSEISLDPYIHTPKVGPRSAGAYPGPVCYGFGGTEPTVTDVDLILGYLDDRFFLDGRAKLNRGNALEVFKAKIADPLGMEVMQAAGEVYRLTNSIIYDLLHKLTIERGLDPRSYVMFSYGGTAGMHVTAFARQLGVSRVIIPHSASVHGAFGLMMSDVTHEEQLTRPLRVPADPAQVNAIFSQLAERVTDKLKAEGFGLQDIVVSRAIDLRFRRQVHVVTTPVAGSGPLGEKELAETIAAFEKLYEERFGAGSGYKEAGIEMVNFRLRGVGLLRKPELKPDAERGSDPGAALVEAREVYFGELRGVTRANCYDFEKLVPGNEVHGPAVIWTPITTVVVNPGQRAWCDPYKNLHVFVQGEAR